MAATVHVIARWVAKAGKEDELKGILTALIPPSRREIGCYQYDLLHNPGDSARLLLRRALERRQGIRTAFGHSPRQGGDVAGTRPR